MYIGTIIMNTMTILKQMITIIMMATRLFVVALLDRTRRTCSAPRPPLRCTEGKNQNKPKRCHRLKSKSTKIFSEWTRSSSNWWMPIQWATALLTGAQGGDDDFFSTFIYDIFKILKVTAWSKALLDSPVFLGRFLNLIKLLPIFQKYFLLKHSWLFVFEED